MRGKFKTRHVVGLLVAVALVGAAVYVRATIFQPDARPAANSIVLIAPFQYEGAWVFTDLRAGLVREPFVAGVPEMIDVLVKDIPNAGEGFRLYFSAQPFPDHQKTLTWLSGSKGGNYYRMDDPEMDGWLCPALFAYYEKAPKHLYVKAEAID